MSGFGTPGVAGSSDGVGSVASFNGPYGISVDGSGNVYVTDTNNNRIDEFNPSTGSYLGSWGSKGSAHGQFLTPQGIVVDAAGNIYVNDYGNNRIEVFAPAP